MVNPLGQAAEQGAIEFTDCSFATAKVGWAVGTRWVAGRDAAPPRRQALALETRDGGETWSQLETDVSGMPNSWLSRVTSVDDKHVWAIGGGGISATDMGPLTKASSYEKGFILRHRSLPR
jgi:photosystem II stability/assembly factor-like uncharacterized protein